MVYLFIIITIHASALIAISDDETDTKCNISKSFSTPLPYSDSETDCSYSDSNDDSGSDSEEEDNRRPYHSLRKNMSFSAPYKASSITPPLDLSLVQSVPDQTFSSAELSLKNIHPSVLSKCKRIISHPDGRIELEFDPISNQPLQKQHTSKIVRILSIDGGGIRGTVPANILKYIEEQVGKPIVDMFHVVGGTSTGGILASAITAGDVDSITNKIKPLFKMDDLAEFYPKYGAQIFQKNWWSLGGLWGPRFYSHGLHEVLYNLVGERTLAEATIDTMIFAYDNERRDTFEFCSWEAQKCDKRNFKLYDVAEATAAAPTYFPPKKVMSIGSRTSYYSLSDGGVCANNPAADILTTSFDRYGRNWDRDYLIVSLGTGETRQPIFHEKASAFGFIGWGRNILDMAIGGTSSKVDRQLGKLLPPRKGMNSFDGESSFRRYYRFQPSIPIAHAEMSNTSPENIHALEILTDNYIQEHKAELDQLCQFLRQEKDDIKPIT